VTASVRRPLSAAVVVSLLASGLFVSAAHAQQPAQTPAPVSNPPAAPATAPAPAVSSGAVTPPAGYVIGPEDVLSVVVWREKDLSVDVVVRPDGRITLPLINEVVAAGLTPDQLKDRLKEGLGRFVEDPNVTVGVKQINSLKVFITGLVSKPGVFPLTSSMTVLQLISLAGGLNEFADSKKIVIMRTDNGVQRALNFNYQDVRKGKNLKQNIELQAGDTVIVP